MNKVILIRYGEIYLKGKNRKYFEDLLQNNIKNALKGINCEVNKIPGRFVVENYDLNDEPIILNILKKQPGILSFSDAYIIDSELNQIINFSKELMADEVGSFKVVANRADKAFTPSSMEINRLVGGEVLSANPMLTVDVNNPDIVLSIDIRENKKTLIFTKSVMGVGGMPVSSAGKGLVLLSGGIDSPVSGYMMAKRGTKLVALHFHSYPYTSELARLKVEELAKKMAEYNAGDIEVYMCSMTKFQEEINRKANNIYNITLLRRAMFTIAERLCKDKNIQMIITGENLGQVASQTIESMTVVGNVVKDTQIMRPLIAFDKQEIINIARQIDTFDISIRPYEDCCTVFVPDNPIIKPKLENVLIEEAKLDFDSIVNEAYSKMEKVIIKA